MAGAPVDGLPACELVAWLQRERPGWSDRRWARALGVSNRQVYRWRHGAVLRWSTADRVACALGLHPAEIWGDAWWVAA